MMQIHNFSSLLVLFWFRGSEGAHFFLFSCFLGFMFKFSCVIRVFSSHFVYPVSFISHYYLQVLSFLDSVWICCRKVRRECHCLLREVQRMASTGFSLVPR